jgi:hypothetical protein
MSVVKYFAADFANRTAWVVAFKAKKRSSRFTRFHLNWNSLEVPLVRKGNTGHSSVGGAEAPATGRGKLFSFNLKEQFLDLFAIHSQRHQRRTRRANSGGVGNDRLGVLAGK